MEEHNKVCTPLFVLDEKSKFETIQICRLLYMYLHKARNGKMCFRKYTNFIAFLCNFSFVSTKSKIWKNFCVSDGGVEYILNKPKCIQADFEYCKQIFLCGAIY